MRLVINSCGLPQSVSKHKCLPKRPPVSSRLRQAERRPKKERGAYSYAPFQDISFDRSLPSSHAARAFSLAAVFADHYSQPVPFIAYSTASLIGLSRIFLDEHFASDVLAGAALGFAIGKTLSWRHRNRKENWMILPMVPGKHGGSGPHLSVHLLTIGELGKLLHNNRGLLYHEHSRFG